VSFEDASSYVVFVDTKLHDSISLLNFDIDIDTSPTAPSRGPLSHPTHSTSRTSFHINDLATFVSIITFLEAAVLGL
jgi:hypothetical protein